MSNKRVLIVDDDSVAVDLLSKIVALTGAEVHSTIDPFEGYRIASEEVFDLILLDIMMPNWSGLSLCREIRLCETARETPIYFVSAYDSIDVQLRVREAGGNGLIFKPINAQCIIQLVNETPVLSNGHLTTA